MKEKAWEQFGMSLSNLTMLCMVVKFCASHIHILTLHCPLAENSVGLPPWKPNKKSPNTSQKHTRFKAVSWSIKLLPTFTMATRRLFTHRSSANAYVLITVGIWMPLYPDFPLLDGPGVQVQAFKVHQCLVSFFHHWFNLEVRHQGAPGMNILAFMFHIPNHKNTRHHDHELYIPPGIKRWHSQTLTATMTETRCSFYSLQIPHDSKLHEPTS